MDFAADLPVFYADFGTDADLGGTSVRGIFTDRSGAAFDLVTGHRFTFQTSRASPIQRGALLVIDGVSYKTKAAEILDSVEVIWALEVV